VAGREAAVGSGVAGREAAGREAAARVAAGGWGLAGREAAGREAAGRVVAVDSEVAGREAAAGDGRATTLTPAMSEFRSTRRATFTPWTTKSYSAQSARCGRGLTLVHFSAQLEPCLTQENTLHTLNTP